MEASQSVHVAICSAVVMQCNNKDTKFHKYWTSGRSVVWLHTTLVLSQELIYFSGQFVTSPYHEMYACFLEMCFCVMYFTQLTINILPLVYAWDQWFTKIIIHFKMLKHPVLTANISPEVNKIKRHVNIRWKAVGRVENKSEGISYIECECGCG